MSGSGPALAGATVTTRGIGSESIVATTDANGVFELAGVPRGRDYFVFSKPGYEDVGRTYDMAADKTVDVRLYPRLDMSGDDALTATLYPDDPPYSYWLGDAECATCKRIHVHLTASAMVEVRFIPESAKLCVWVESPPEGGSILGTICGRSEVSRSFAAAAQGLSLVVYEEVGPVTEPQRFQVITATR